MGVPLYATKDSQPLFIGTKAVASGDFNSNVRWDANRSGRNHTEVVRLLENCDLISAYHTHHDEKQGSETRPTYYLYRHQDKAFHIDYVFAPKGWQPRSVEVGSFREWRNLSDHVPVVVDVRIGDSR
jgi:endonuclease/exonuclease/phosphatase family metal-dependent hydrolase